MHISFFVVKETNAEVEENVVPGTVKEGIDEILTVNSRVAIQLAASTSAEVRAGTTLAIQKKSNVQNRGKNKEGVRPAAPNTHLQVQKIIPLELKILFWNVRGCNKEITTERIKDMQKKLGFDILILAEIKNKTKN